MSRHSLGAVGLVIAATALLGTVPRQSLAQSPARTKDEAIALAERIIADEMFFPAEFAKRVQSVLPLLVSGKILGFFFTLPEASRPDLAAFQKKYGPPDRVTEEPRAPSVPGAPVSPVDTLYTYGALQLGISKGSNTGKIEVVKIIEPK